MSSRHFPSHETLAPRKEFMGTQQQNLCLREKKKEINRRTDVSYDTLYSSIAIKRDTANVSETYFRYSFGITFFRPLFFFFSFLRSTNIATRGHDRLTANVSVTLILQRRFSRSQNRTRGSAEGNKRSLCREHVTIRSHRGPRRDSIRWFPSPNSTAGALVDPTLQSFPGNDCHYRAREGERERVDERSRGIGLYCDCVPVWSHWPTNCDYGDGPGWIDDLYRRGWWLDNFSLFSTIFVS